MRLLLDENFDGRIADGIRLRAPECDFVRAQDTDAYGMGDPDLLEWAARHDRILITHDLKTMPRFAYARVANGLPMPGVIEVSQDMPIGFVIDQLLMIIGASSPSEYANKVVFLPL